MESTIIILIALIFLYLAAIRSYTWSLFLFIFFLPVRPLLDIGVSGVFSPNIVFGFILLFHFINKGYLRSIFTAGNAPLKALTLFIVIIYISILAISIRESLLLGDYLGTKYTTGKFINKSITALITILDLIGIVKVCLWTPKLRHLTYQAIIASAIFIVLSMYFAPLLFSLGINIREAIEENTEGIQNLGRISGLYSGGDVNSLGAFLNLVICIILIETSTNHKAPNIIYIGIITFLSTGILICGSRMGFFTLLAILAYYFIFINSYINKVSPRTIAITVIGILILVIVGSIILSNSRFALVLERIQQLGITSEVGKEGNRYVRWMGFLNFIFSDISNTILGAKDIYFAYNYGKWFDPHNFFIKLAYFNGIILPLLVIWSMVKLFRVCIRLKLLIFIFPLTLIILIAMTIISQIGYIPLYILYIGILMYKYRTTTLV